MFTASNDEWVCAGFESGYARADNEHGSAESTKRALHAAGPQGSSNTVDAQTGGKSPSITKLANNLAGVRQRANKICAGKNVSLESDNEMKM